MDKQWRPKGWLAIIFGLILQPFAFLYVNKQKLFWGYIILAIGLMLIDIKVHANPPDNAWYKDVYLLWLLIIAYPTHAFIIAKNYDVNQARSWYASWWATSSCFLLVFSSVIVLRAFYFEPFSIPAGSMSPTLNPGDQLIVTKNGFGNYRYLGIQLLKTEPTEKPNRGDIIVFQYPQDPQIDYVKRVIALPGDKIIYRNKTIFIKEACSKPEGECPSYVAIEKSETESAQNNVSLYEESLGEQVYSILIDPKAGDRTNYYYSQVGTGRDEWLVPDGHYFVLGDNRDNSLDSRFWGFVPEGNIIGKSFYIW